jgi:abortive infection bacteriophage resistance protein
MQYKKPPLSYEEQADLLMSRGLIADRDLLVSRLKEVNYYRITGYLYPFRQLDNTFVNGTTFNKVWNLYTFDRQLRIVIIDAIERIEVSVRSKLVYSFTHKYGPFGYCDNKNLPGLSPDKYAHWINDLRLEIVRSREKFIEHFEKTYADCHDLPPLWMAAEIVSFGKILTLFRGVDPSVRQEVAKEYGLPDVLLESWLMTLNIIRNICAHHGRLWNKELRIKPKFPPKNKYPEWYADNQLNNNRICVVFMILRCMVKKIAPQSKWKDRVQQLFKQYPDVNRVSMGFFEGWEKHPLWK